MPTAAKLVAALSFAAISWLVAHLYGGHLQAALQADLGASFVGSHGWRREICAGLGLFCGWWIMGPYAARARGGIDAMAVGLRTAMTIVLAALLLFACAEMLERAMKGRFRDPLAAMLNIFEQAMTLAQPIGHADILGAILLGGLLSGLLAYWAYLRWDR